MYAAALAVPLLMLIGLMLMQRLEEALLSGSPQPKRQPPPAPSHPLPDLQTPDLTLTPALAAPAVLEAPVPVQETPVAATLVQEVSVPAEPASEELAPEEESKVTTGPGPCGGLAARQRKGSITVNGTRPVCTGRRRPAQHRRTTH